MSQNFNDLVSGVTTFGNLYGIINANFAAVMTFFSGTSFPASPVPWQPCVRTDLLRFYYYSPTTSAWEDITDLFPDFTSLLAEVTAARGTAASLAARLGVALNADGTLIAGAPAGGWWSTEAGTVARVSASSFTVTGDKSAIYKKGRALFLDQTTDAFCHVSDDSTYSSGTGLTTVNEIGATVDAGLAAVQYGQPVENNPKWNAALTEPVYEKQGTAIAAASTVDLAGATGNHLHITGTGSITSFGTVQAGAEFSLVFDSTPTITHNATSLILPTGANVVAAAGDVMKIRSEGSGNWRCSSYQRANGQPLTGASSKWSQLIATTDFSTTAASTSTITMVTDETANIRPGMAIKFKLSGTIYYAICTAIAADLLTIAGAPLTTDAGALTELYYSSMHGQVIQVPILIPGYFADTSDTALLSNDNLQYLRWNQSKAYLVLLSATQKVADSGSENTVNCSIAGSNVFSTALTLDGTAGTWANTVIAVTTANYDVNYGEAIEIAVTKVGNGDCRDLSLILTFVGE